MGIMMIAGTERRRQGCSLQDGKQWGFTNNTGRPYITFPFKFSNVFTAISCICHNGSPSEANTVYNVSISGMNIGASGGGSGKYWCAFGVAQQQWGYYVESQNPTDYRYWSIPFTSHYITMATKTYYEPKEEAVPWLVGIDMQKFICGYGANFIGSSYVSCVGIGCQPQWGTNTIGSRTTRTEAYPLPYSEFCLPIVSGKGYVGGLNYGFGVGVTNFGLTSVTIANNSEDSSYRWTGYTYIVVGAQPQWRNNPGLWAIPFTEFVAGGITMTRTGSQSSGTWYGDSGTISLTGYTASCATNESWVSNISGSAIAVGL